MTGTELLRSSFRLINWLGPGQTPGSAETIDAQLVFNSMLDALAIEHLTAYTTPRELYNLVAGTQQYTFGASGAFNAARPVRLEAAGVIVNGAETPLDLWQLSSWNRLSVRSVQGVPEVVYSDEAYPLARLHFFPVPDAAYQVALYPWRALTAITVWNTELAFPPGYVDAIRYNLAVRLALEWGRDLRPKVAELAAELKGRLKAFNAKPLVLRCEDVFGGGNYNIQTGSY